MIHRSAAAALGVVWRLYFSRNTSVLSAEAAGQRLAEYTRPKVT